MRTLIRHTYSALTRLKQTAHRTSDVWNARNHPELGPEIDAKALASLFKRSLESTLPVAREDDGERKVLLRQVFPRRCERVLKEASQAAKHVITLMGYEDRELGPEIDWHRDDVTGHRWDPKLHYNQISPAEFPGGFDIKIPWELGRGHHLVRLAQAYFLTGDEHFASCLRSDMLHWIDKNPWPYGVGWACSMDVAIRAVNWLAAVAYALPAVSLDDEFYTRVCLSLSRHGTHIEKNLEGQAGRNNSNHYLANLLGLRVLGHALPMFARSQHWKRLGENLASEFLAQTHSDGSSYEGSVSYHRLVLEIVTYAYLVVDAGPPPRDVSERLSMALAFVHSYTRLDGLVPIVGDQDSGRVLRWGGQTLEDDNLDHRYLFSLCGPVASASSFRETPHPPKPSWEAAWTLSLGDLESGSAPPHTRTDLPKRPALERFPEFGLHIVRNGDSYLAMSGGGSGQDGLGSHSHNDDLGIEFCTAKGPVFTDSGSGVYTADYHARHFFRSVWAHSTVVLNGREPTPLNVREPFALRNRRPPRWLPPSQEVDEEVSLTLEKTCGDGASSVVHRRKLLLCAGGRELCIKDTLSGGPWFSAVWLFQIAVGSLLEIASNEIHLRGEQSAVIRQTEGPPLRWEIDKSHYSPAYGRILSRPRLKGTLEAGQLPCQVVIRVDLT